MADIELVIKIPEEIYKASQIIDVKYEDVIQMPLEVIATGTLLLKGHGRLIDADVLREEVNSWGMNDYEPSDFTDAIDDAATVEAIPKDQYETRLKADMVAMLNDLDLKIDEMYEPQFSKEGMDGFYWAQGLFKDLVQEQINALRGNENA